MSVYEKVVPTLMKTESSRLPLRRNQEYPV